MLHNHQISLCQGNVPNDNLNALQTLLDEEENRDLPTRLHTERVSLYAKVLSRAIGRDADECDLIRQASRLHDIGKRNTPHSILYKDTGLTPKEYNCIKLHTIDGAEILLNASHGILGTIAAEIALQHHEMLNGTGYHGLMESEIPWYVRVVTIADTFDVMTSSRSYKDGVSPEDSLEYLFEQQSNESGLLFDKEFLDIFSNIAVDTYHCISNTMPEDTTRIAGDITQARARTYKILEEFIS